jgi:hypothetical protein
MAEIESQAEVTVSEAADTAARKMRQSAAPGPIGDARRRQPIGAC